MRESSIIPKPSSVTLRDCLLARLHLRLCAGIGPVLIQRAVEMLGSPQRVLAASARELSDVEGIGQHRAEMILKTSHNNGTNELLEQCTREGIDILCPEDPAWPVGLRTIPDPPVVLFVRGRLLSDDNKSIGIVGSRRCSLYGREQSHKIAADLANAGITIVSGGARGVDTAAHIGALRAGGRTVVVQGCGLHHCYPQENADLYQQIVHDQRGALVSEMAPDEPPLPENFPPRNRIIAGMTLGILVVEANLKSGSLITARLAADDYGREVFALPGRVDSPASAGTHHLLKTGSASLVENARDILLILGGQSPNRDNLPLDETPDQYPQVQGNPRPCRTENRSASDTVPALVKLVPTVEPLTPVQEKIVAALNHQELEVDAICDATELKPAVVLAELTFLQILGHVRRISGHTYSRR